jgi:hypothetical protein
MNLESVDLPFDSHEVALADGREAKTVSAECMVELRYRQIGCFPHVMCAWDVLYCLLMIMVQGATLVRGSAP